MKKSEETKQGYPCFFVENFMQFTFLNRIKYLMSLRPGKE